MDYEKIVTDAVRRYVGLYEQVEEIELEKSKLRQFIMATVQLLPDEKRQEVAAELELLQKQNRALSESLIKAIRAVLQERPGQWMTAAKVRDRLVQRGFDFSGYSSNPLASVNTTLKRLFEKESPAIAKMIIEGATAYQWKEERREIS